MPTASTTSLTVAGLGPEPMDVPVTVTERGSGRPILLLHGGAGPFSVAGLAELLAAEPARVLAPIHPGFDGTARPAELTTIRSLAVVYAQLLRDLDLTDVCVVGNSIGGWIAAELALAESSVPDPRVSSVVLVDAVGLEVDGAPMPDYFSLTRDQVFDLAYFNPDAFRIDPATLSDERIAAMAVNNAALLAYGGTTMADASLLGRLPGIAMPALVVWGAADRIAPVEHGRAYAAAIPGAQFRLITAAGHLPQLEAPAELMAALRDFASSGAESRSTA
jgi:pimeloyl-ACP methyl ester carboxylesterase